MIEMTTEARGAANSLAIAYDAYNDARKDGHPDRISIWGRRLIKMQDTVGVELYSTDMIRRTIAAHKAY